MLALCPLLGSAPSEVPTLGALQAARVLGFLAFTEARFGTLRPAQAAGSFCVKACFGSWLWVKEQSELTCLLGVLCGAHVTTPSC